MEEWRATNGDQSTIFTLVPGYDDYTSTLPGPGTVYRVDGKIVAVKKAESDHYVPTAMSGTHAITVDVFALVMSLGLVMSGLSNSLAARRTGVAWDDTSPPPVRRRSTVEAVLLAGGTTGVFTTFILGIPGPFGWGIPIAVAGGVAVAGAVRMLRRQRGFGRHAA